MVSVSTVAGERVVALAQLVAAVERQRPQWAPAQLGAWALCQPPSQPLQHPGDQARPQAQVLPTMNCKLPPLCHPDPIPALVIHMLFAYSAWPCSFGHAPTSAAAGKTVPPLRSRVSDVTSNRRTDGCDSPTDGMSPRFSTPGSPLSPPVYAESPMQMYSGGAGAGATVPSPRLSGTLRATARLREKMPTEAGIPEETSGELRRSKSSSTSGHSAGSGGGLVAAGPSGEGHVVLASSLTRIVTPRGQRGEPIADRENGSAAGREAPITPVPPPAPLEVEGAENGTPVSRAGGLPFVAIVPPDPLMPEGLREEARGQNGNGSPTQPSGQLV